MMELMQAQGFVVVCENLESWNISTENHWEPQKPPTYSGDFNHKAGTAIWRKIMAEGDDAVNPEIQVDT